MSKQCRETINKYDVSQCSLRLNPYIYFEPEAKDVEKMKTLCSNSNRCGTDTVNAALNAIEKDCKEELIGGVVTDAITSYALWIQLPYIYAAQCAKVGDKYCAIEGFYNMDCTECQKTLVRAVLNVKFNRKPLYNIRSTGVKDELIQMAETQAEFCKLDIGISIDDIINKDTDEIDIPDYGHDHGDHDHSDYDYGDYGDGYEVSSSSGLYTNILGTLLAALSVIGLSW
jgi:hypothetical protein